MGWAVGFDNNWGRDIGYGVPAICDHPECNAHIDRGLYYVCGGQLHGGEQGCGLFFCEKHLYYADREDAEQVCGHCLEGSGLTFEPKPDPLMWVTHKLKHESWAQWRRENADIVERLQWTLVQLS